MLGERKASPLTNGCRFRSMLIHLKAIIAEVLLMFFGSLINTGAALMLENSIYMEQNYKACFGMLMLRKQYGSERLEAACTRALQGSRINYTMIKNILARNLDKQSTLFNQSSRIPDHNNLRGKEHYR